MSPPLKRPKKPTAAKLRNWLLRQRAQPLEPLKRRDEWAAEAAAVEQFSLNEYQARRLVVRRRIDLFRHLDSDGTARVH